MEVKKLKDLLTKAGKCVTKNSSLHILDYIKIDSNSITSTDLESFIEIQTDELDNISCCVEYKSLKNIIDKIKTGNIEFEQSISDIKLKTGKGDFSLPILKILDFPETPVVENSEENLYIDETHISKLKKAVNFCSNDELRPEMCGVYLDETGYVVSTDSHILYNSKCDPVFGKSSIINKKLISLLDSDLYIVEQDQQYISFKDENITIISRKIEGNYPNWKAVIPQSFNTALTTSKKDLLDTLDLALLSCNQSSFLCKFDISDKLTISSQDIDYSKSYKNTIKSNISGNNIEIGFSVKNLIKCLKSVDEDKITMQFVDPSRAAIINNEYLIMPMIL